MKAIVSAAILLSLISLTACGWLGQEAPDLDFPDKSGVIQVIPEEGSSVSRELKTVDEDGIVRETHTEYRDGTVSSLIHRPDSSRELWSVYYPGESGNGPLKFQVYFDPDEKYLGDQGFRPDGSLERAGNRRDDGDYDVRQYFLDGETVHKHFVYGYDGKMQLGEVFRQDESHSLVSVSKRKRTKIITTHFDQTGIRLKEEVASRSGDRLTRYYDETGQYVENSVKHTLLETIVLYFDSAGNKLQRREFWDDRLFLDLFDETGKVAFRQRWLRTGGDDADPVYALDGLVFHDQEGNIVRTVDFHSDHATPREVVVIHNPGEFIEDRTFVFFDARGRFERAKRQVGESGPDKPLSSREVAALKPRKMEPQWLEFPEPYEWPERVIPPLGHSDLEE